VPTPRCIIEKVRRREFRKRLGQSADVLLETHGLLVIAEARPHSTFGLNDIEVQQSSYVG
jgi:hypothetical protein